MKMDKNSHPLDQLSTAEIKATTTAINEFLLWTDYEGKVYPPSNPRFSSITLKEPPKAELLEMLSGLPVPPRQAQVIFMIPASGRAYEATVDVVSAPRGASGLVGDVVDCTLLEVGTQPCLLSPDECALAESIVKEDSNLAKLLNEKYGITDTGILDCDPWGYHVTGNKLGWSNQGVPLRLVQTFLYMPLDKDGNHYAQTLDVLPVVDLNSQEVVHIDRQVAAPKVPQASANSHRNKTSHNAFAPKYWCVDPPKPLEVVQSDGPSFRVQGNAVRWQKWSLRVGFNYREGLVVHDARFDGRPVMWRGSLVEMAVPYGDPREPFTRKCNFNAGDYGLGFCAESLEMECDSVGNMHYFDAVLNDSRGQPYLVEKAVCMHEEDDGVLWKQNNADYRNGHNGSRRSRRLVLSFVATVMNYEYLFYWYFMQDGRIEFEVKLSGELSTNLVSEGVLVAPEVNAQVHQHIFCARLDMSVDGYENAVEEVDIVALPNSMENNACNAFHVKQTPLMSEMQAQREAAPHTARSWVIQNNSSINPINGRPVSYKLLPQTYGPIMVTDNKTTVTSRSEFATKALWVTQHSDSERWPSGDFTGQNRGGSVIDGFPAWMSKDRSVLDEDVVLWHSFGLLHVPRVEDFPMISCKSTGFTLKPDGFLSGNPNVDIPPERSSMIKDCSPFQ